MGRFPYAVAVESYYRSACANLEPNTARERRAKLLYVGRVMQTARDRNLILTMNPAAWGEAEILYLTSWARDFDPSYRAKLWQYVASLLRFLGNPILDTMKARGTWKRPPVPEKLIVTKDEAWYIETMARLDGVEGWVGIVLRFVCAFVWGTGVRSCELRNANLADLDSTKWTFRVMNPKGKNAYGLTGAELDIFEETKIHVSDYLAARTRRILELGFDPAKVTALVPNERGTHYSPNGWRTSRWKWFSKLGISGDYRALRRTHAQLLVDRLEAAGYKEGAVLEVESKRLRHSIGTAQRFYANLRTRRARDAAREAWETFATNPVRLTAETKG